MSNTEMEYVIGLDFGNFYSQPCLIMGIDPKTRRGGTVHDLTDPSSNIPYGIPTAFFYASNKFGGKPACGAQAIRSNPPANCLRYLKRDMMKNGQTNTATIDGRTFTYDEMIIAAAQHALRIAAAQLKMRFNIFTNKVALAYPASIGSDVKNHLVELIEQATFEVDGKEIKAQVVGTIAEPAAAALNYLAEEDSDAESTIIVYDFGAGTFDVSVVTAYPAGKQTANGDTYYYDVVYTDGLPDVGGREIDAATVALLSELIGSEAKNPQVAREIIREAENVKIGFTNSDYVQPQIVVDGVYMDEISREQFERKIEPIVRKTVDLVDKAFRQNPDLNIDMIVLTGGSSQMPIVRRMLQERFPAFRDKIRFHQPSKAIATGAARFGIVERDPGVDIGKKNTTTTTSTPASGPVVIRTIRDIGVRFFHGTEDKKGYITTYIPSGTPIPYASQWVTSTKLGESQHTRFCVFEATNSTPDVNEVQRDYAVACDRRHDHGRIRPKGYETKTRIVIDEKHLTYLEVVEPANTAMGVKTYSFSVEHLLQ